MRGQFEAELPYQLHTNRELGLMLRGAKPLAVFADYYGHFPEAVRRYLTRFDVGVEEGRFVKRELVELPAPGIHVVLYALKDETWRIDAMIELRGKLGDGWTEELERAEGDLLGYEPWECDAWLERLRSRQR